MLPDTITTLMECQSPCLKPPSPVYPSFGLFAANELPITVSLQDFSWLLARSFSSPQPSNTEDEPTANADDDPDAAETEKANRKGIPVWSAYNSRVSNILPTTAVGMPPLIAAPVTEWPTLLTTLMQAQNIAVHVAGPQRKTVITLDMGLYQPSKKLQMARNDLNNIILRVGELHVTIAQLRTIGAYIEDSGIDMCWVESGLYGPATVRQILEGNHVKRGE